MGAAPAPRHPASLPPPVQVMQWAGGARVTMLLATCVRLGVFDALDSTAASVAEVADRLGFDPDALHRVLRAAATIGAVSMDPDGQVSLTEAGSWLRNSPQGDSPSGGLTAYLLNSAAGEQLAAWAQLDVALRDRADPYVAAHGHGVWADFVAHPDRGELFDAMMGELTALAAPALVAAYPWPSPATVVDLGGGTGVLLSAVLAADPGISGVVVDQPDVLERAAKALDLNGLRSRVGLHVGDLLTGLGEVPRGDLYLLKEVLHDWDDKVAVQILRHVRAAVPATGRLIVIEMLQPANLPLPSVSLIDIQMMVVCYGGRQRSTEELTALLDEAGFTAERFDAAASGHTLITAR